MKTTLRRTICVLSAGSLFISASAAGLDALGASASLWIGQMVRRYPGPFTDRPGPVNLGLAPGRAAATRGGMWSAEALENARYSTSALWACTSPGFYTQGHTLAIAAAPGETFPWEGAAPSSDGSINTGNGDKITKIPLVSWKCRGGMTLDFTLYHNSESNYNDELGNSWTWSYDIYVNATQTQATLHWGDGTCVPYTVPTHQQGSPVTCTPPAGIHDKLVLNADGTWTVTTKDQIQYSLNASGFCHQIQDRNGTTITLTLNSGNYVTQISDPTGRTISISLSGSNKFQSITDPLNRTWSFTINGSGDLSVVTWPLLDGDTYTDGFSYSSHRITTHTDRASHNWTATYNSDGSIATQVDPLSHSTAFSYTASATMATDPLSHATTYNYFAGKLASRVDPCNYSVGYTYDSNNNVTQITDKRGKVWQYSVDSMGNVLTETDPNSHEWVWTYNSANDVLTETGALSHETVYAYSSAGNLTSVTDPLNHAVSYSWDSNGECTSVADALNNSTTGGHDSN